MDEGGVGWMKDKEEWGGEGEANTSTLFIWNLCNLLSFVQAVSACTCETLIYITSPLNKNLN